MGSPSQANPAPCKIPLEHRERFSLLALNPTKMILSHPSRAGTQPGHAPGIWRDMSHVESSHLKSSTLWRDAALGCQCPSLADANESL